MSDMELTTLQDQLRAIQLDAKHVQDGGHHAETSDHGIGPRRTDDASRELHQLLPGDRPDNRKSLLHDEGRREKRRSRQNQG